jgi:cytochrome c556
MRFGQMATILGGMAAVVLMATTVLAQDGKAAFEKRRGTMKEMSRAFYIGVGRVAKGQTEYGPDTVVAVETVARLAATYGTLFPPGSDVEGSRMKPAILAAPDRVVQLVANLQATIPDLVAAVQSGDKARIAETYATTNNACNACHKDYRAE